MPERSLPLTATQSKLLRQHAAAAQHAQQAVLQAYQLVLAQFDIDEAKVLRIEGDTLVIEVA